MPSLTAFKRCPQAIFLPPRFDVYRSVSRQIIQIFHAYTDLVEPFLSVLLLNSELI
jgi:DNA polymerase-4